MAEQTRVEVTLREAIESDLGMGGPLSQALPGYEQRPAQIEMARKVAAALESGEHLIVEAATGTGKSLAYLLPIVRSGKVALISTANKNLQEQLFYKDIPFVQQHVAPFEAALIKGMGNYLCLDRLEEEQGFQQYVRERDFSAMLDQMDDDDWDGDLDPVAHTSQAGGPGARIGGWRPMRLAGLSALQGLLRPQDARPRPRRAGDRRQPHAALARRGDGWLAAAGARCDRY